jgi:hypothetical protein
VIGWQIATDIRFTQKATEERMSEIDGFVP